MPASISTVALAAFTLKMRPTTTLVAVTATSRISVEEVHFGHFFYGRLEIVKMRQEHFPLKRRVHFRCHVVVVVDALD
jgi:hypothetical protein